MDDPKILQFPQSKIVREIPDSLTADRETMRQRKADKRYSDNSVDDIMLAIRSDLEDVGIDIDKDVNGKDYVLLTEALRSIVYKHFGFDHWLQELAQERCEIIGEIIKEEDDTTEKGL
jgi:hypothetical protein